MKVSNLLPLIALVLVTATASSIVDTINSLDHATASNADRILKSEKKDLKSEKKDLKSEKKKKDEKKVQKKATKKTKSNKICEEIMPLEMDNKIRCTDDCSDNYLTCADGKVVEIPLAQGEKCYENGIVRTSEGNCVLATGMNAVMTFDFMDACTNYPELDYCSTTVEAGEVPYTGTILQDGTWYFKDQVTLTYIEVFDVDNVERGWRIYLTIRFGHDKEPGRSRTIVATMDYGTTRITRWMVMDKVEGDALIDFNCLDVQPEPITVLIEEFLKNPTLLVGNDKGEIEFQSIEVDTMFTTELVVKAEELGEDYMMEKQVAPDSLVTVLAKRADMSAFEDGDPVGTSQGMYLHLYMLSLEAFLDDDYDFTEDIKNGLKPELIPEIIALVLSIQDESICFPDYEQIYRNVTDVATPIIIRGELLNSFPQTSDLPGDKTEDGEIITVRNRALKFDSPQNNTWVKQDFDDLTESFDWTAKLKDNKFVEKFTKFSESVPPAVKNKLLEELRASLLGTGAGLPEVEKLLVDLVALDELLLGIYDLSTSLEDGLVDIYKLIVLVLKIEPKLNEIRSTLSNIDKVASIVGIIKQTKFIVVPVRNAIKQLMNVVNSAIKKTKKLTDQTATPAKPEVRKLLNRNEKFRTTTAKTAFVNHNYLIVPANLTRNCKSTNDGAKFVYDKIDAVKSYFEPSFNLIQDFSNTLNTIRNEIATAINALEMIFGAIVEVISDFSIINTLLSPFNIALNSPISLTFPGPFCTKRVTKRIAYPCGIRYCRSCGFFGCITYPCGLKFCSRTFSITLPSWCNKRFSFTIAQIIEGIQGLANFILAPLNRAVDAIINALPIPKLPFPTLPSLDFKLPLPDFPNLPDLNVPAPFNQIVPIDLSDLLDEVKFGNLDFESVINVIKPAFPEFVPICASTDTDPTKPPTKSPTNSPTKSPTNSPTTSPTKSPTNSPTKSPTKSPTHVPSLSASPSTNPSSNPSLSAVPSTGPSDVPSLSASPSTNPSSNPSLSAVPSTGPSDVPSLSASPSTNPSGVPSLSASPSTGPSSNPSLSAVPSTGPSDVPSLSASPSTNPSSNPSLSAVPSTGPSDVPSLSASPSTNPSSNPSLSAVPSTGPSDVPSLSASPSTNPSSNPSLSAVPSTGPSNVPSLSGSPSTNPSTNPSSNPSLSAVPSTGPSYLEGRRNE